jgi:hypothetical protein
MRVLARSNGLILDVADKATVAHVPTAAADTNNGRGLRSPVLLRRNSVGYGRIISNFAAKSHGWSREPGRLASLFS